MANIDLPGGGGEEYRQPWDEKPPPGIGPPPPTPTTAPSYNTNDAKAVQGFYTTYTGRAAAADDPQKWLTGAYGYGTDLGSIENAIKNSGEAQAYAKSKGGASSGASGDPGDYLLRLLQGGADRDQAIAQTAQAYGLQGGQDGYPLYYANNNTIGLKGSYLANVGGKWNKVTRDPNEGKGGSGGYGGTSVFSDPATQQFEQLLNGVISRFNTSATPQHYQQTIDQLNKYLGQLNGPVYTPEQMNLLQTQAWDPMQQQHDTAVQQLTARLGAQGISPSSGIFQKAMEDLNRQFEQAHTQTNANFATNAIGLQRQNQAQAAALAPQISNFEQAQTGWQDSRALQAANLAQIIPNMAQQRLQGAAGMVQPLNPLSLLNSLGYFQNQGYNQGAGYGAGITQLLAQLFGLQ